MGGGLLEQGVGRGGRNRYLSPCQVLSYSAAMDSTPFSTPYFSFSLIHGPTKALTEPSCFCCVCQAKGPLPGFKKSVNNRQMYLALKTSFFCLSKIQIFVTFIVLFLVFIIIIKVRGLLKNPNICIK